MNFPRRHPWVLAAIAAVAAVIGSFTALNFTPPEKTIENEIVSPYGIRDDGFRREMDSLLGVPFLPGNRVTALLNGRETFPAMLDAIRSAKKTICLETYIYWSGKTGHQFSDALRERARAGVKVHILVDWFGSQVHDRVVKRMKEDGIAFEEYHPLRWYDLARLNNRTHRRILVVDGTVGFTGGAGIQDTWRGNARNTEEWRDTNFKVEGPVVGQMEAGFMDNWIKTRSVLLHGPDYFPPLPQAGTEEAQFFQSAPTMGDENIRLMYLLAIASARESITLSAAYFVPDALIVRMLVAARQRGVAIRILLPGDKVDIGLVRLASRGRWGPLLAAGVRFYEYQPTMFHCKVLVIDGIWSSVGSTNLDNRSFRINDESTLNVYDAAFAARQLEIFENDLKSAREVTPDAWRHRPFLEKIANRVLGLVAGQM